jgi:type I restriction enzyme R subunit
VREDTIESGFIGKLQGLKYDYRRDITNRATLEQNFREKFEALNRVRLTDAEFARLLDEIVVADVFTASKSFSFIHPFLARPTWRDTIADDFAFIKVMDWVPARH